MVVHDRRLGRRAAKGVAAALAVLLWGAAASADTVRWQEDAPARYTVQNGDTLWDIAERFLSAPWQWPRVWRRNPQVDNPSLIYPGDVLYLRDCDGAPCLGLERGRRVVKLSPQMRTLPRRQMVPPLPMRVLDAFLRDHRVVNASAPLDELAYVIGGEDRRLISGAGDQVFVRAAASSRLAGRETGQRLGIFRPGETYQSATGEPLGQELSSIGEGVLVSHSDDIARLHVHQAAREVRRGDVVLPLDPGLPTDDITPRAPRRAMNGRIVGVPGGVRFIGRLQVVAIDLGTEDGLQPGHVLRIAQQGERVADPRTGERVRLPGEVAGSLVVFRPYDRVSYAIVMAATGTLSVGDSVRSPR